MIDSNLVAPIGGVLVALAGWLNSHSEVSAVKRDREQTKTERDTEIAILNEKVKLLERRLDDGSARFDRIDEEIKTMNAKLTAIIGRFDTVISMWTNSHWPGNEGR